MKQSTPDQALHGRPFLALNDGSSAQVADVAAHVAAVIATKRSPGITPSRKKVEFSSVLVCIIEEDSF